MIEAFKWRPGENRYCCCSDILCYVLIDTSKKKKKKKHTTLSYNVYSLFDLCRDLKVFHFVCEMCCKIAAANKKEIKMKENQINNMTRLPVEIIEFSNSMRSDFLIELNRYAKPNLSTRNDNAHKCK